MSSSRQLAHRHVRRFLQMADLLNAPKTHLEPDWKTIKASTIVKTPT
jgi:hypothetical protein